MQGFRGLPQASESRRRLLLGLSAWALPLASRGQKTASDPSLEVLTRAAVISPKASGAAMLAVTRAGARLVAVGERGIVLLSDDGGHNWQQAMVPVQTALTCVCFIDERLGWAAGHAGVVLHSQDGGLHWHKQIDGLSMGSMPSKASEAQGAEAGSGLDKPLFDLFFIDALNGYAVGAYNLLLATQDGGKTWLRWSDRLDNPKALHLYGIRPFAQGLLVVGEQGLLLQSGSDLESFRRLSSPYQGSFFGLLQVSPKAVVAYGLKGSAFRSDGGLLRWESLGSPWPLSLSAGMPLADERFALLTQTGSVLLGSSKAQNLRPTNLQANLPATGIVTAPDGSIVVSSLRGMHRLGPLDAAAL